MKQQSPPSTSTAANPLGSAPVGSLLAKFAVPAIISMLVNALYNIVDQIFIGQGVGMLGNAATNIAFPVTTISTAAALLLGIGGASNYNLEMGAGNEHKASEIAGSALSTLVITGVSIAAVILIFLRPLLIFFGATDTVMPYATDYVSIIAIGLPFFTLSVGGNHLIRADRSPTYSMTCTLTGAVINTILDPLFIFGFKWGIKGGAWATVIGQIVSAFPGPALFYKIPQNVSGPQNAKATNAPPQSDHFTWNGFLHQSDRNCSCSDRNEQYPSLLWINFCLWK